MPFSPEGIGTDKPNETAGQDLYEIQDPTELLCLAGEDADPVRIQNLWDRLREVKCKVFVLTSGKNKYVIAARSRSIINSLAENIQKIVAFGNKLKLGSLIGNCIDVHRLAAACGISDGNLSRAYFSTNNPGLAAFDLTGNIHQIGYKVVSPRFLPWRGNTISFDLTSTLHIFRQPEHHVILVMVDDLNSEEVVGNVYQCDWQKKPLSGEDKTKMLSMYNRFIL